MLYEIIEQMLQGTLGVSYARQDALGMLDQAAAAAKLAEAYKEMQTNYQKTSNAMRVKARPVGPVNAGSFVFPRFKNATVNTYGTARTAGAGVKAVKEEITVNLSTHKEIVEEFQKFDLDTVGYDVVAQRIVNHSARFQADLDRAFWSNIKTAVAAYDVANSTTHSGNILWPKGTAPDYLDLIEQIVVKIETTQSNYIDNISRDLIFVALKPAIFSKVKQKLDTVFAFDGTTARIEVPGYQGVMVFSESFLPANTDFIAGVNGPTTQLVRSDGYTDLEKIDLSNAWGLSLFWDRGEGVLAPEAFYEGEFAEAGE